MTENEPLICQQRVTAADNCCIEEQCTSPASWLHAETGLTLCELHESNARRYGDGEEWMVGAAHVSFPAGWERLSAAPTEAPAGLEVVRQGSDLVTWEGPSLRA